MNVANGLAGNLAGAVDFVDPNMTVRLFDLNRNALQAVPGAQPALFGPMVGDGIYEGTPQVLPVRKEMLVYFMSEVDAANSGVPRDWRKPVSALGGEERGYSQQALQSRLPVLAPLRESRLQLKVLPRSSGRGTSSRLTAN